MIELRALTDEDVQAHNAGEDDEVIRWLSGAPSTDDSTRRHFAMLAENASRGAGKRGFGIWFDGQLAGYVDFDPDANYLPAAGDVNISYAVHRRARRRGGRDVSRSSCMQIYCGRGYRRPSNHPR
ncbi:GNAT family N-acetyltransferase [Arthrobacter sp. ISL-30]|uniref:GNAT family N-acetyltransferase n=1 Tax=Arthrobacter sp. ISL-30 TaxID=2819109 RepID=UPI001BEA961C|nr:GNAT family N-acetyltransferase [Arthrobacter sp. ISL-30]MBT2514969.1 hypothetical protein [Arthrobacter sp. ISL-30]